MTRIIKFLQRYWPIIVFISIYLFIFRNVFFKKLVPFPGDLLASWFFPYNSGGWEGYSLWITHKEFILADVIRQIFPWRILSMDLLKQGIIPLWNVYAFSGNPLLANVQSAVFYPINVLFFIMNDRFAWIVYIMLQPILSTFFMYLFIRSLKLSKLAALISGIGFSFIGYIMVWFEMGNMGHAVLWLPFILWGLTKFMETKKTLFIVFSAFGIAFSILAGHSQTTAYVLIFALAYLLYVGWNKLNLKQLIVCLSILFLGITLAAIQIIPTLELMNNSARDAISSTRTFHKFITPPSHIAMLFAPDFFGNPATGNFWGKDYGEFMSYSGVIVLILALIGFYSHIKNKIIHLLLSISFISFLIAFVPQVAEFVFRSQIPILAVGLPSRTILLVGICLAIAAAYGVEAIQKLRLRKIIPPVLLILAIYIALWIIVFKINIDPTNLATAKRNLIMPTGIAFLISFMIIARRFTKYFFILWIAIFISMAFEYSYFMNKYLPLAPMQYMFPSHKFIDKLSQIAGDNRVYGYETASFGTNLSVQFRLLSPEGYDPLYIRSYSELMHAGKTGKYEIDLPRSDALFTPEPAVKDPYTKQVLLNLMGVRYVVDKDDTAPKNWDPRKDFYPPNRFNLIYQEYKYKIFENKMSRPRAAIFYDYTVVTKKDKSIATLFNPDFPYQQKLILENKPAFTPKQRPSTPAKIINYSANSIKINTQSQETGLLFLSDNYYPGWQAYIDNKSVSILKADYTFRAVELPKGKHEVRFEYQPYSFYLGAFISLASLILLGLSFKKKDWN